MNCTEKEFEIIVWSKYPHKHMSRELSGLGENTVFALDTIAECKLDFGGKARLASHVWQDGAVIIDSDNLFSQTSHTIVNTTTSPITFTMPNVNFGGHMFTLPAGYTVIDNIGNWNPIFLDPPPPPKCECGAHKVGSNMHSSWCGIKNMGEI